MTLAAVTALTIGILTAVSGIPILIGLIGIAIVIGVSLAFALPLLAARTRR
jgi:hypothetical protein